MRRRVHAGKPKLKPIAELEVDEDAFAHGVADHKKNDDAARATTMVKAFICDSKSAHLVETMTASSAKRRA